MAFNCCLPTALIFALVNTERAGGAGRIRVRSWSACGSFRTPGGKLAGGAGGAATRAFVAKDQASPYSGRAHVSCLKVEPSGYRVQERGWPTTR